jgi:hypothetical protein
MESTAKVPMESVLARYQQLLADSTLQVVQLSVLVDQLTRERDDALVKLAAVGAEPTPWPYGQAEPAEV